MSTHIQTTTAHCNLEMPGDAKRLVWHMGMRGGVTDAKPVANWIFMSQVQEKANKLADGSHTK